MVTPPGADRGWVHLPYPLGQTTLHSVKSTSLGATSSESKYDDVNWIKFGLAATLPYLSLSFSLSLNSLRKS